MFLEMLGVILVTFCISVGDTVNEAIPAANNNAFDKGVLESPFVVVVTNFFAVKIETFALDSVLGLLKLFLR
jgi:hypothetical protein